MLHSNNTIILFSGAGMTFGMGCFIHPTVFYLRVSVQPVAVESELGRRITKLLDEPPSVMMYRCLHGLAPQYLADHLTPASDVTSRLRLRSANRHQLIVPRCRLNTYDRQAFLLAGPTVWNSLPRELRDPACGFDSFKQFLKTIFFSLY